MNPQIFILFIINTFISMGYSLIAPLFPILGQNFRMSEKLLGCIISIYSFSNFSITPFCPQIILKIGRLKIFYISTIIQALSIISYGLFKFISNFSFFIFISFTIRILHGFAGGISSTLLYSLGVSLSSPEEITISLGYLEIAWSVGISIGPVCTSFLYHFGGYSLPFYIIGIFFFIPIYLIKFLNISNDDNFQKEQNPNFFLFFNFEMLVNFLPTVVFQIAQTYYFPSLIYHLINKWSLKIKSTSLFFMIPMVAYFIGLQILNKILSNFGLKLTILLGQIVIIIGAPFVFPIKFLPQSIISIIFGLCLLGISGAFTCVAVIIEYGKISKGINNNLNESSINDISSAVFNLGIGFGDFLGPFFGGFISTKYGFLYSNVYMSVIAFFNSCFFFFYYKNEIIFVIKDILYFGFKDRFLQNDIHQNDKSDFIFYKGKIANESFRESFWVVDKNLFLNESENNG